MTKRVFIIHGWEGNPQADWFPWLKRELEKRDFQVFVPAMPNPEKPKMKAWVSNLAKTVGEPDPECYLVGHSLGCITILRYLETLKEGKAVGGVLLVAGFAGDLNFPEYKGELSSFFGKPLDWKKLKITGRRFISIHSDNDPYVPLVNRKTFEEKLKAEAIVLHKMGHLNIESGVTELPIALDSVLKLSNS